MNIVVAVDLRIDVAGQCYSRARDSLALYTPQRLPTHPTSYRARHVLAKPSRFLTDAACALTERVEPVEAQPAGAATSGASRIEIPALAELFQ